MKTLYLMRHAAAEAPTPAISDFDRALSETGAAAARLQGRAMQARGWLPEVVLCSAARRAVQTWEHVAAELATDIAAKMLDSLYLAPPSRLLATLHRQPRTIASVLLIAHNPGLHSLARAMSGDASATAEASRLRGDFPSATLAVFVFATDDWAAVAPREGCLTHVVRPGDLA